jgi:putative transposase
MEGVAERLDRAPSVHRVVRTSCVLAAVAVARRRVRRQDRPRPHLVVSGQRHREGAKRGDHTGPNPTDRAKSGSKRHVLTDSRGIPVALTVSGANVHDKWALGETLDSIVVRDRTGAPSRPKHICLDKGYDYADTEAAVRERGIKPHIRRRGEQPLVGCIKGKPRRWVVERTNSWHNQFRGLLIRWERKAAHYIALCELACALITYRSLKKVTLRF